MKSEDEWRVVLVTVTYGDRVEYLSKLLEQAFSEKPVVQAIVVSNAATSDLGLIEAKWGGRVSIVRLSANTGSANGYSVGIDAALATGVPYLWLMDDDNIPAKGAIELLRQALGHLAADVSREKAAVAARRQSRSSSTTNAERPPDSSFLGFHVGRKAIGFLQNLSLIRVESPSVRSTINVRYAPYGGLLAHRDVFRQLGLPKKDLVVYADDWEYTMRLTSGGGVIRLIPEAQIVDLGEVWYGSVERKNIFAQSLVGGSDFRVYYTYRNHVWLDRNFQVSSRFVYAANKAIFISLLLLFALKLRRLPRLKLILSAIRDGERGALGVNAHYPLP